MSITHNCTLNPAIDASHPLHGKTVYLPVMGEGGSEVFVAIFRRLGVEAHVTPPSSRRTIELGGKLTQGDECYPIKVVIGDLLQVAEIPRFDPARTVYFLPTSDGPCRFGQYVPYLRKVLREAGFGQIEIISPSDTNSYGGLGSVVNVFTRMAWRGVVASDSIHRLLLKTRPYETVIGAADRAYNESLQDLCETIESACDNVNCQLRSLVAALERARDRFRAVPAKYDHSLPLVGVVGEIFCRLNIFSNEDLVRRLEAYGAEASLSHVAEWVSYTSFEQERLLRLRGQTFSLEMLGAKLRNHVRHADEHALLAPLSEDLKGYEEPEIEEIIKLAWPYLPADGVAGEMVLSVGLVAWHAKHGADGIIDISPFACMNGTVSEAVYPKVSRDYGGIPIRSFYFDGTRSDLDRDLGVYLELARSYRERKPYPRTYPACFRPPRDQDSKLNDTPRKPAALDSPDRGLHLPPQEATQE
jgi:predicted nucleotide-binding protein (sugar kinase/HSP70/actin superfamily)